jgi:anti-sigma B factor antagonist
MHELSLWIDDSTRPVRVVAVGDLDLDGGDRLEAVVAQLAREGLDVALDLSAVGFMDSSGLGAVISVAQGPARVVVEDASPEVLRVIELTGTTEVIELGTPARVRGRLAHIWADPAVA